MKAIANVTQIIDSSLSLVDCAPQGEGSNHTVLSRRRGATARGGFTLIEMLVVLAVTAILFTLIFRPLVDSLNLTNRASAQIESQVEARQVLRDVSALLNNAAFVFDNKTPDARINLWFPDKNGAPTYVPTQFAMIEFVPPARQQDQDPSATIIDPTTGLPYYGGVTGPKSGFAFPITAGRTLVRIFPGLRNNMSVADTHKPNGFPGDVVQDGMPTVLYGNRFSDPNLVGSNQDNRYSLFRADVTTSIPDPNNAQNKTNTFIPNLKLFHTGVDKNGATNTRLGPLILHDPNFFYDNSLAGDSTDSPGDPKWAVYGWKDINGDGKVEIWENWRAVSSSQLTLNRADAVALQRNDDNSIVYDATNRPIPRPLVTFAPAYVENDPGVPTLLSNTANETGSPAPVTFNFQNYRWANPYLVSIFRGKTSTDDPLSPPLGQQQDFFTTTGDGTITEYHAVPGQNPTALSTYGPFLIANGIFDPNLIQSKALLFAFTVDPEAGHVNFSFPSSVMIYGPKTTGPDGSTNYYPPLPSQYDPATINAGMVDSNIQRRYLDLRTLANTGTYATATTAMSPLSTGLPWSNDVFITPGSERVYGPDQRVGPHYGQSVLYTRVASTETVGINQYKINYVDVTNATAAAPNNPVVRKGYIEFDSLPDTSDSYDPNQPDGLNSLPVHKADANGKLLFNTPSDPVLVYYSFQMNRPNDVVKASYQTRQQMVLSVEARIYDASTGAPQTTTLTQSVQARNLQR